MVHSQSEKNLVTTTTTSTWGLVTQQKQVDEVVEEYKDIFTSLIGVPLYFHVKHSVNLIPGAPLQNGIVYRCSLLENQEIKPQIKELLQKGHM